MTQSFNKVFKLQKSYIFLIEMYDDFLLRQALEETEELSKPMTFFERSLHERLLSNYLKEFDETQI